MLSYVQDCTCDGAPLRFRAEPGRSGAGTRDATPSVHQQSPGPVAGSINDSRTPTGASAAAASDAADAASTNN